MVLPTRVNPLSNTEIEEFFAPSTAGHLKYRLTMLLAWKERIDSDISIPFQDALCGFEAALIASRLFVHFFGLRISHRPSLHLIEDRSYFDSGGQSDEVKVVDLGGTFVTIDTDLTASEADLLARAYNGANKASAHLTSGSNHEFPPDDLPPTIEVVSRLLRTHLYEPVGRNMERHYD